MPGCLAVIQGSKVMQPRSLQARGDPERSGLPPLPRPMVPTAVMPWPLPPRILYL